MKKNSENVRVKRIVGGSYAQDGQFPYHLSIEINGKFRCGGSIINKLFALTAAHCLFNQNNTFDAYDVKVWIGHTSIRNRSSAKFIVEVEKVYVPKEYGLKDHWFPNADITVLKVFFGSSLLLKNLSLVL